MASFAHRATSRKVNFMPHPVACSAIASSSVAAREYLSSEWPHRLQEFPDRDGWHPPDLNKLHEIRFVSQ
jgi:hypothetical protein